jgi:hypothetical protein
MVYGVINLMARAWIFDFDFNTRMGGCFLSYNVFLTAPMFS